jgi:hypothetical protein
MAERPTVATECRQAENATCGGRSGRDVRQRARSQGVNFPLMANPVLVEDECRSEPMKVDSVALPTVPNTQAAELSIIKAEDIKAILYLGIKGEIKLDTGNKHTVDTYA